MGRQAIRIVVTGSSGLIGKRLLTSLEAAGHETVPFDIRRGDAASFEDVRDPSALARALTGADGIVHLAAISRVAWGEANPGLCKAVNVGGVRAVLEALAATGNRAALVFASSREVYGDVEALPVAETAEKRPINVYARSKAGGEVLVEAAVASGLRAATVRLSSVYGGIDDHHDRVVPALLANALVGQPLVITGADHQFDFVHVDDCVAGLMRAVEMLGTGAVNIPTVHLASGLGTSLAQLANLAVEVSGSSSPVHAAPARPFDVKGFVGDPRYAREMLGWQAETDLRQGLSELAAEMGQHGLPLTPTHIPDPDALGRGWMSRADMSALPR